MLRRLVVDNYVLIDRLELELDARLNIITGETGAGKSILLGALGLLLGARNEGATIKDTTRNCVIEGTFHIGGLNLQSFFDANDLDYDDEVTIRRIITPAGKSRSFVGDLPAPLTVVRELGVRLLDIHSQHSNLILSEELFRTHAIDLLADDSRLLHDYAAAYARMNELRREVTRLRAEAEAAKRDEEWIRYQYEELAAAKLREGEQAELEEQQALLAHAGTIGEKLELLRTVLDDETAGALPQLKAVITELHRIENQFTPAAAWCERLQACAIEMRDIGDEAAGAADRLETDPEKLERIDNRLAELYSLCQKHRVERADDLIPLRDRFDEQLGTIVRSDEAIRQALDDLARAEAEATALAAQLHDAREAAAPQFEKEVLSTLRQLGMVETRFIVQLAPAVALTPTGGDIVTFLFSANTSGVPAPVEKIASGGELSRVMLAIKALLARRMELPTILFDEIDTGVSGRIADAMGRIISDLSSSMQVIDITHIPQVASKGGTHFVVYKQDSTSNIRRLSAEERIDEIAKMLSGTHITDAARTQARILLGR